MVQSSRLRRHNDRNDQGRSSKKRSSQSKQPSRAAKKHKKNYQYEQAAEDEAAEEEAGGEELFKVEKIVDCKPDKNGVPFYKTRWKGYTAADDTWEPSQNVASTGHIDRYERQQRQRTLKGRSSGVAVIEYEDGERETIDMRREKIRGYHPDESDADRDDDSADGDADVNNLAMVTEGAWIEILWRHTHMYFPCKVISWTPLRDHKSKTKSASSRKGDFDLGEVENSSSSLSKHKDKKPTFDRPKRNGNESSQRAHEEVGKLPIGLSKQKEKKSTSDKTKRGGDESGQRTPDEVGKSSLGAIKKKEKKPTSDRTKRWGDETSHKVLEKVGKTSTSPSKKKEKRSNYDRMKRRDEAGLSKQKNKKPTSNRANRGENTTSQSNKRPKSEPILPIKISQPELAPTEPTQDMFWRIKSQPQEKEDDTTESDTRSVDSESSGLTGLSDDVSDFDRPVQRVGHGIPLYDEPEGDFDSSSDDDDSDSDDEGERIDAHPGAHRYPSRNDVPKLSFEELWTLKLRRTQELMDRGSNCVNDLR